MISNCEIYIRYLIFLLYLPFISLYRDILDLPDAYQVAYSETYQIMFYAFIDLCPF